MSNILAGDGLIIILLINALLFFVLHGLPLTSSISVVNRYAILAVLVTMVVVVGIVTYQLYKNNTPTRSTKHRVQQTQSSAIPEKVLSLLQYYVKTSFRL